MEQEQHAVQTTGTGVLPDFFEFTPMALWLEDYSALHEQFTHWRAAGIADLGVWLRANPARLAQCASLIQVVRVNRRALTLFEAQDEQELMAHLPQIVREDTSSSFADELEQLWEGAPTFHGHTVNYTVAGRRLDLSLKGVLLACERQPWDRVLVAMEDITELQALRRSAQDNARLAREFFEQAPVSLWVEDFSQIKVLMDGLRKQGISDFRTFLNVHEDFVERCMQEIRLIDVNDYTLRLFKARDRTELRERMSDIFPEERHVSFGEQLLELWNGNLSQVKEVQNLTLQGDLLYLHLQWSVFKGSEDDWGMVLLSLTDITARKKAEAYLEYLGQHDVLTQLKNRSFFVDEIGRLARRRVSKVAIVAMDLNNLKQVNDESGHAAGDELLRRFGEVLNKAIEAPAQAARIGGDEFMVLWPGAGLPQAEKLLNDIRSLVHLNNQYHSASVPISVSAGIAVSEHPDDLEQTMRTADRAMYEDKHRYYSRNDRRRPILPVRPSPPGG